jgi:Preprotein translocase subunit SecY
LIIVVVVMDFIAQMQSHLMSQQYEGLMKKANLKKLKLRLAGVNNESKSISKKDLS